MGHLSVDLWEQSQPADQSEQTWLWVQTEGQLVTLYTREETINLEVLSENVDKKITNKIIFKEKRPTSLVFYQTVRIKQLF